MIKIQFNNEKEMEYNNIREDLRTFLKSKGFELDGGGYDTKDNIYEDFFYNKYYKNEKSNNN